MESTQHNAARALLRIGDLNSAAGLAQNRLRRYGDQGSSPGTWSPCLLWAAIPQQRGQLVEAPGYLTSKRVLYPPGAQEIKDPLSISKWAYNNRVARARLCRSVDRMDTCKAL